MLLFVWFGIFPGFSKRALIPVMEMLEG